ncbi:MAG: assimilatory sulfite reductase (NADPH) flavoprotein subunit, partial [Methylococcaceae bacterium]|nr:assimilatory sulfite reductase (NADPH) flavoprotein subunit [Methylococcaceae bacterium]
MFPSLLRYPFPVVLVCLFGLWAVPTQANERHSDPDGCFSCHGLPGLEYLDKDGVRRVATILEADYYGSLHGSVPCKDCHRKIERYPHKPEEGYVDCSESCHVEEPSKGKAFTHKEVVDEFKTSAHGSGHAPGATKDFHGGNRLKEMKDEQNPSCRRCHSNTPYIKDAQLPKFKEAFGHMDTECGDCHQGETWRNQFSGHILRRLVGKNYNKMEANAMCVDCHGDEKAMAKVKLEDPDTKKKEPADFRWIHATDSYDKTLHGRFLAVNDESGAGCIDCHAPRGFRHGVQRAEKLTSSTHPDHLAETCSQSKCHGYSENAANDYFTKTDVHAVDMLRTDLLTALPTNPFGGDASNWYRAAWILGPLAVVLALSNFLWTLLGFSGGSPAAVLGGDHFQRVMLGSGGSGQGSWWRQLLARMGAGGDAGAGSAPVAAVVDADAPITGMTLLYASQTGNGEGIAADLAALAEARGYTVKLMDMAEYEPADLASERLLFIVCSTHGDGDPPIAAEKLHGYLYSDAAPRLVHLKFGVFALGDSSYKHFCRAGKDFDAFLERLGGKRVLQRGDADVDFEEPAAAWMQAVLASYREITGDPGHPVEVSLAPGGAKTAGSEGYGKNNPYPARVLANIRLNGEGSAKETRHLEIELAGSGLTYEAGDALAVCPKNSPAYIEELLSALSMDGYAPVSIGAESMSLREALYTRLDSTALSRVLLEKYAELVDSGPLRDLLAADEAKFQDYVYGRDLMDLVVDFPIGSIAAQDFVGVLRRLPARLYSISSSPKYREGEVHLTIGVVRYQAHERQRDGVCSTFVAGRLGEDERLGVYVQPNKHFRLPDDTSAP